MTFKATAPSHCQTARARSTLWAVALGAILSVALTTQVLAQIDRLGNSPDSPIHAFGETFAAPAAVVEQQMRMVFYRTAESSSVPGAASIYVNGAYHASLVPGGYSQLCLPLGKAELAVKSVEIGRPVKDNLDTITLVRTEGGQTQYLRVQQVGRGRQLLQPVAVQQALQEMASTREQTHTISRVPRASECVINGPVAVAHAAAVAASSQTFTVAADALFAFGRSDLRALSLQGKASLDALVARLRSEYVQLDRLNVIGHADPLGQAEGNERLAWERAQTVREYLLRAGLVQSSKGAVRMSSEGRGAREPLVRHCGLQATPEAIACHAPNRRVVLEISGTRH